MTKSMYLYGCESDIWDDMLFYEALEDRKERAFKIHKELLLDTSLPMSYELEVRRFEVHQAFQLMHKIIQERKDFV